MTREAEAARPPWFSTLLTSIESSISRCISHSGAEAAGTRRSVDAPLVAQVLPLSARTPEELDNLIWWWANVLEDPRVSVARSCATAALRRHHPHRAAVVASEREAFLSGLRAIAEERLVLWCEPGASPEVVRHAVLHVRGKWVDWRAVVGQERRRLFAEG